ncbi:RNA 3'-terminal phosphate cyclase [Candidatus Woesearchaeota archaeon]|nr:RNA 3'-terminal phosphate cyclase [Candidatus Woesearchaeota archaeon]
MIEIDGSYLEGGGQIARTALALSTITQKPFEIVNIRKGRDKPGLKNQHLFCIKALEKLCGSRAEGAELGSTSLRYWPGKIKGGTVAVDVGTAGSISLLLQSIIIPSMLADSKVRLRIKGGTDVSWSPQFDYMNNVIMPHMRRYADIEVSLIKRGYYPKGGGEVDIRIKPRSSLKNEGELPGIILTEQHNLIQIKGVSHASIDLEKANVAERQAKSSKLTLSKLRCPIQIRAEYQDTLSTGSGITLWAVFSRDPDEINITEPIILGADCLGKRGRRAEDVGKEAALRIIEEIKSGTPVDRHLADNLIPMMGLAPGSRIKVSCITDHTKTNVWVTEQFLPVRFKMDERSIECCTL